MSADWVKRSPMLRRGTLVPVRPQRREAIQWAHDRTDGVGGHLRVERGGVELGMPEQDLDQANIRLLLQQVGGEAVPQGVRRYSLLDLGHVGSSMNGAVELSRRYREQPVTPREQPCRRSRNAIPIA